MAALLQRRRLQMGGGIAALAIDCAQVKSMASEDSLSASTRSPTDDYDFLSVIGQGTTSCVRLGRRKSDGSKVAIKLMRSNDSEMHKFAKEEYDVLKRLNHPHIIHVMDFFTIPGQAVTVMECFQGLELSDAIEKMPEERIPEMVARELSRALFGAVDYLHKQGVVHRDIKPQNVMVDSSFTDLKLVDFNTACQLQTTLGLTPTGSRMYAAPEVLLGESPSGESDTWGAGLCTHLMLCGRLPQRRDLLWGESPGKIAVREISFASSRWRRISPACKDVLYRSLAIERCDRPSAEVVLALPWFIDLDTARVLDGASEDFESPLPARVAEKMAKRARVAHTAQEDQEQMKLNIKMPGAAESFCDQSQQQPEQQRQHLQQHLQHQSGEEEEFAHCSSSSSNIHFDDDNDNSRILMYQSASEVVSESSDEEEEIPMVHMRATRGTRRPSICVSPNGKELIIYESGCDTDEPPMSYSASCLIVDDDDETEE